MSRLKNFPISSSDIDFKSQEKAQHDTYIILLNHWLDPLKKYKYKTVDFIQFKTH